MQIQEFTEELKADMLALQFAQEAMPKRSPGTHVTDVLRWIERKARKDLDRPSFAEMTPEEREMMALYTSMGWAWEFMVRWALQKVWCKQFELNPNRWKALGELKRDNIIASPDWFDKQELAVEEFKATWKSSRRDIETHIDFRIWFQQIMAYCFLLQVNKACLRVFFVNGDYAGQMRGFRPKIRMWKLRFTDRELAENWIMIVNNARAMEREKNGQQLVYA